VTASTESTSVVSVGSAPAVGSLSLLAGMSAAAAASRTARTSAEVEVALDTPDRPAAERVAGLGRHGTWTDRGRLRYVGAATGLVGLVSELARQVDGVRLHPVVLDEDLSVLSRLVIPPLIIEHVVSRPLPGTTFRAVLGLPRPLSRYHTSTFLAGESR
jgi:hypothetical protein